MAPMGSIARLGSLVGCSIHAAAQPLLHGVRVAAAVSLALFVAFYLQLDTPSWAGTTAVPTNRNAPFNIAEPTTG